jgi:hypothetical protein
MPLWLSVHECFKSNNVDGAIALLESFILSHDSDKFSCLIGASFRSPNVSVIKELNRFIEANGKQFDVKAIYLEMNGFDINYDRWYFDLFAYSNYSPDFDEIEWLCEWQSSPWPEIELSGMTSAQQAFAWYHEQRIWKSRPEFKPIYEAAMLLVMAKFVAFVGSILMANSLVKSIPVLVTAHGFESVARYEL